MRTRRRVLLLVALALIVAVGAAAAVGLRSRGGPPALLVRALEVMPPAADASGLYFTSQPGTLESVYGFAPGRAEASVEQAYAIRGQDIVAVLESGGAASTVLVGRFPADEITAAFKRLGYAAQAEGGWTQLIAGGEAQGPLAASAEAVAVRRDAIVIGTADEVARVVRGDTTSSAAALLAVVPAQASVVAVGPSYDEMVGDEVAPPDPDGGPQRYGTWLLVFWGDGDQRRGVVAQVYTDAHAAAAGELAGRINAEPSVGSGPDALVLEAQQPRWDAAGGVATVDVTASGPPQAWAQLRSRIEAGEAGFLRQP